MKSNTSQQSEYFPTAENRAGSPAPPMPVSPTTDRHVTPPPIGQRPRGGTRNASKGGGVQVVLDETGSWSELGNQNTTLPADSVNGDGSHRGKPNGMLGFLSRKKGRERSPKPQESGVLGKEGARVVINSGGR